jgi:hypothetical protein
VDTDSGEDGENNQRDDEFLNGSVGDSVSEENCSDCEEHESSETDTSLSEEESPSEAVRVETLRSKDGTEWIEVDHMSNNGRIIAQNLFISKPGVKPFAKRSIESPTTAWQLLFRKNMLEDILKCTNEKILGVEGENGEKVGMDDLKAFIGLVYLRGAFGWRQMSVKDLWSKEFGNEYFKSTMSRNKFERIMRFIRFDNLRSRRLNAGSDLYYPIRWLHEEFTTNCMQVYQPNPLLTVDEQLLPMKNRCKFIQFMPQKPDKFGVKMWVIVDVKTKYCIRYFPYLGSQGAHERGQTPLGMFVVKSLMEGLLDIGYNVCTDNFFTSAPLADYLFQRKTTLVGTIRPASKSIVPAMKLTKPLHSSTFYRSGSKLAVTYQGKPHKNVTLISTMHSSPVIINNEKKKPEIIHFYNSNKVGVDCIDRMLRLYSCKSPSR